MWITSAFVPVFQQLFLERGTLEILHHAGYKVLVVQITAFLPSVEELGLLLFD
jgi:hypothetical protein